MAVALCFASAPQAGACGQQGTQRLHRESAPGPGSPEEALTVGRTARLEPLELTRSLAPFGPRALLEVLAAGAYRGQVGARSLSSRSLTSTERSALFDAVAAAPAETLSEALEAWLEEGPGCPERTVVLEHFAARGAWSEVGAALAWAQCPPGAERPSRELVEATERALTVWFRRDPQVLGGVRRFLRELPLGSLPGLLRAVAHGGGLARMEALASGLGVVPEFDRLLVSEIGMLATAERRYAPAELRAAVRAYLDDSDRDLVQEAIAACRRLDDWDALPRLIELLDADDGFLRETAFKALGEITGEGIGRRAQAWRDWRAELRDWYSQQAPRLVRDVESGTPAEASRALMELARERHMRHELALACTAGLGRGEREVQLLTAATLGALGSAEAVPALLEQLGERDTELRRSAYLALCRITGEDYGDSPENWENAGW